MSQYIPEHSVRAGQVRTWCFNGEHIPVCNGSSFLVTAVDGVRAEVTGEGLVGSYYVVWLASHSEIAYEEG